MTRREDQRIAALAKKNAAKVKLGRTESLDGVSLRPLFDGKKLERDALYFHYPHFAWHEMIERYIEGS